MVTCKSMTTLLAVSESQRELRQKIPDISGSKKKGWSTWLAFGIIWTISSRISEIQAARRCNNHWECPRDQICDANFAPVVPTTALTKSGLCRCPSGFVSWRWSCEPLVPLLNDNCFFSLQCKSSFDPNRHCSPITNTCVCDFKYRPIRGECIPRSELEIVKMTTLSPSSVGLPQISSSARPNPDFWEKDQILSEIAKKINHTLAARAEGIEVSTEDKASRLAFDEDQVNNMIYIGLAFLFVFVIGTISTLFMRMVQRERKREAFYKGFADIMAGTTSSADVDASSLSNYASGDLSVADSISYGTNPDRIPTPSIRDPQDGSGNTQDKIVLPPLEKGLPQMPSPHMSAPVLPPIKQQRVIRGRNPEDVRYSIPRPQSNEEVKNPSIQDISRRLEEVNSTYLDFTPLDSAASFPK